MAAEKDRLDTQGLASGQIPEIAERTEKIAKKKFPDEVWKKAENIEFATKGFSMPQNVDRITIANSRLTGEKGDERTLLREIRQAKIATKQGDFVYLLPKLKDEKGDEIKGPDAVWNGKFYEFKTVDGNIRSVEDNFRYSRKQCKNVFMKITNKNLTKDQVLSKIKNALNDKKYTGGTNGILSIYLESDKQIQHFIIRKLKPKW